MSDPALESDPDTVEASSDCELTVALGSAVCSADCTETIWSLDEACTYTVETTSPAPESVCATSSGM